MLLSRIAIYVVICVGLSGYQCVAASDSAPWPFFAFDNGVGRGTWEPDAQAEVLHQLGYDGIGYTGVANLPAMIRALDDRGLKMFSTYVQLDLDPNKIPYDSRLTEAVQQLKRHGTALWLHIHGARSATNELDDRAVDLIRGIADMARPCGLPIVLYPHTGFYVATTKDAIRLVKKIDRDNVKASFNLCHFLKQNDPQELESVVTEAMPHLALVSINGADSGNTREMGWDRLIQTLEKGSFDVGRLLKLLKAGGYKGPVGLQCYAISGDIEDNLRQSISAWRKF